MSSPNLIEWVRSINETKDFLMTDENRKSYVPFVINNALANWLDTILLANFLNQNPHLSKELQYRYLHGSVRPQKRYGKWAKAMKPVDTVMKIADYFGVSYEKGEEAINILGDDAVSRIIQRIDKAKSLAVEKRN